MRILRNRPFGYENSAVPWLGLGNLPRRFVESDPVKKSFGIRTSASMQRSVDLSAREPSPAPGRTPTNEAPTCAACATAEYLVYDEITLQIDARGIKPAVWDIEYWCGNCESVYGILTTHRPDDGPAMRLAVANPRVVNYSSGVLTGDSTKVYRAARTFQSPSSPSSTSAAALQRLPLRSE